jgi:putative transposase
MAKERATPEQIIAKLREAEDLIAQGETIAQAAKRVGATENTYYRRRREYGGMKVDRAKRLKELEKENGRLKRLLADADLDKAILREAASGRYRARRSDAPWSSTSARRSAPTACRGAGRAGSWAGRARRGVGRPPSPTTSHGWWRGWSGRRRSTAATATAG